MHYILFHEKPKNKKASYLRICANFSLKKTDPYCVRCTVGGNLLEFDGPVRTPCCDMTTFKLFLNSIISSLPSRFVDIDIENFYLGSDLPQPEYMVIPYHLIPPDIIQRYNLDKLKHNNQIMVKIVKGI